MGAEHRVASYRQISSEQSVANEPPNSRNRQRVLLPLESGFSTMSDPSIVIDLPTNTWESNRQTSLNRAEEISLNQDIRIRREEDITHILLFQHLPLCLLTEKVRSQRGLDIRFFSIYERQW